MKEKLASRLTGFSESAWSVGCIAIKAGFRGKGYPKCIINAVIELARNSGAERIEAYPTRHWDESRSYRGSYGLYKSLGFEVKSTESEKETEKATEILLMVRNLRD
ncbi:GNAT family N-acetyltransferase [bacterium]|nr:GNAT family N-acetyltransferase [bacterium]